uniref:Uncharacterized protein n=1 Tax=Alexandrium catenella TaxID=2925 RepID=A0A7S1W9B6_ALECA
MERRLEVLRCLAAPAETTPVGQGDYIPVDGGAGGSHCDLCSIESQVEEIGKRARKFEDLLAGGELAACLPDARVAVHKQALESDAIAGAAGWAHGTYGRSTA